MSLLLMTPVFPALVLLLMRHPLHALVSFALYAIALTELILWGNLESLVLFAVAWGHALLMVWATGWGRSVGDINRELKWAG